MEKTKKKFGLLIFPNNGAIGCTIEYEKLIFSGVSCGSSGRAKSCKDCPGGSGGIDTWCAGDCRPYPPTPLETLGLDAADYDINDDLGGKYLVFVSSRSVKIRGFSFLSLHAF